ncbi:hypothetical protein D3C84_996680 [compost metagenome]
MASDFGASSPSTICMNVMTINPIMTDKVETSTLSVTPNVCSSGSTISSDIAGSPTQPSPNEASVMPSCVADK